MDLFEYQARDLFEKHGIPVPAGIVAVTPGGAWDAAAELGGAVAVKAQVKTGGRGKAGGIRIALTPDLAAAHALNILGMTIRGHICRKVLVTPGVSIAEEYYLSILLDRATRNYLVMVSVDGGMEIEQLAVERPDALLRVPIDPIDGLDRAGAIDIITRAGFRAELVEEIADVLLGLWRVYLEEDALLVEVNPLVRTSDGQILALDGKVTVDDNALFRHPEHADLEDRDARDPLEDRAHDQHVNYVKLDGQVGIIGNGAGLVMSTLDVVAYAGESYGGIRPANFLDIGGGASAEVMATGLEIILSDPQVHSVFVNVYAGITTCDAVASGIVQALEILGDAATKPLVVRLDGNNVDEGRAILAAANHPLVAIASTMDEGAARAAELAAIAMTEDPNSGHTREAHGLSASTEAMRLEQLADADSRRLRTMKGE